MRAAEKIIDGLTQLMEGFLELQTQIEKDFDAESSRLDDEDGEDPDLRLEVDAALVTELRATIEAVMDAEDYSADEVASLISVAQDALEEIDPDVFEDTGEEEEETEDATYYGDDDEDDDYDYDDVDDEEFDDDDFEDEDYDDEDEEY